MRKQLFLFLALLLAALPGTLMAKQLTWSFEWNKSHSDPTAQGFYNFGKDAVDKEFYTADLNGLSWSIASTGTKKYAYTASLGQSIGTNAAPSTHTLLWTESLGGRITAVRIKARTVKAENKARLSVKVNDTSYKTDNGTEVELTDKLPDAAYAFQPDGNAQQGKIEITLDPYSDKKGTLVIKRIEIDYERDESSVPAPTLSLKGGSYDTPQQVTMSVNGLEAGTYSIYYTTDKTDPTVAKDSRKLYTGPVTVDSTLTLKAVTLAGETYSDVAEAIYVVRRHPELRFERDTVKLVSGDDAFLDLVNPHGVKPVTYKSSAWNVCSVDEKGQLHSSYVTTDQTAKITALFAGDTNWLPDTATCMVKVLAQKPLETPRVTPLGGTFSAPVTVTITTHDSRAVTIWYSKTAKSAEEFQDDNTKSVITQDSTVTLTIDKTCTLYVMTRGYNVNSEVVTAHFVINEPLTAEFTTDRAYTSYYKQDFDTSTGMKGWTAGSGWKLGNRNFSTIDPSDKNSACIGYNDGTGTTTLTSPDMEVKPNSIVEFYAYFQAPFLIYGSWQLYAVDSETGDREKIFDAFEWAQDNEYTGPAWNKYDIDLGAWGGKKAHLEFTYKFGGEDLALDGLRLLQKDEHSGETVRLFEGESIQFRSLATGAPDSVQWTFPGGQPATSTEMNPTVTYAKAGIYDVTLTVKGQGKTLTNTRKAYVVVAQKAPTAHIGLPEEGYESPFVGVFIPTGVPVTFRDESTGAPTAWKWVFQHTDITSSTEQNPTVTFIDKGRFSVGLTAQNDAGKSNDMLPYAIQAGGAQYVWNINTDENKTIEKVGMGFYGNYAGTNWLGISRFAEKYKAPLADAAVDSVAVYFASNITISPDSVITLTLNSVDAKGQPGTALGTATLKAGELRCEADTVVATVFHFPSTVKLVKGQPFFISIGGFPNNSNASGEDDIAIFCVRRAPGKKCTAWHYMEDQDNNGRGLGTYQWFENVDDPLSMAIAPVVAYDVTTTAIHKPTWTEDNAKVTAIYNLRGQRVNSMDRQGVYIVKYSNGTTRKVAVGRP